MWRRTSLSGAYVTGHAPALPTNALGSIQAANGGRVSHAGGVTACRPGETLYTIVA